MSTSDKYFSIFKKYRIREFYINTYLLNNITKKNYYIGGLKILNIRILIENMQI